MSNPHPALEPVRSVGFALPPIVATVAVVALVGFGAVGATAEGDSTAEEPVEIETVEVGDGLYMLRSKGGNVGVSIGPDGTLLIDDQFAHHTPAIRGAIGAVGGTSTRLVLNTHWHGDHTGGNANFNESGAVIVAHHAVRERMSVGQRVEAFGREVPPAPPAALPRVTFGGDLTFHVNGHVLHAFHVEAAHTDGDVIVHIQDANVIHMGDTFFAGQYPFFDGSSGGSVDGMISALARGVVLSDESTRIIPGHGPLSSSSDLRESLEMLKEVRERVAEALEQGRSREQVIASRPTEDLDGRWAKGFVVPDAFVGLVVDSLVEATRTAP